MSSSDVIVRKRCGAAIAGLWRRRISRLVGVLLMQFLWPASVNAQTSDGFWICQAAGDYACSSPQAGLSTAEAVCKWWESNYFPHVGNGGNEVWTNPLFWVGTELTNLSSLDVHIKKAYQCQATYDVYKFGSFVHRAGEQWGLATQWFCDPGTAYVLGTSACTPFVHEEMSCPVGNPTLPGTRRKLHQEVDHDGSGPAALSVKRYYRSAWTDSAPGSGSGRFDSFTAGWKLSLHASLSQLSGGGIRAFRPDGTTVAFDKSTSDPNGWIGRFSRDSLKAVVNTNGQRTGFTYVVAADDSTETYDTAGKLQSVRQRNGWATSFTYNTSGQLSKVRNSFGREIKFSYDAKGRMVELLPPGAVPGTAAGSATSPVRYTYEEPSSLGIAVKAEGQLTSVTWQDGRVRRYHYEDSRFAGAMTGITDEAGVRYATYTYDAESRVDRTEHAGGIDRLDFSYGTNSNGQPVSNVTDYAGPNGGATSRAYVLSTEKGVMRPSNVSAPCALCGNTQASIRHNAEGRQTRTAAHDGSVTFYGYDAKGREIERATYSSNYERVNEQPSLDQALSVNSVEWHASWNLPVKTAEPGKLTSYTYDSKGNLTGQSWSATTDGTGQLKFSATKTGSTYATTWGYDANSLATSIVEKTDATETGRWTLTYNSLGDVTSVKDVKRNLTATMTSYDASGRMLAGKTDAGVPINFTYAPRGFVKTKVVNGQTITFVQNAIGLTTEVRTPDNQTLNYVYDATHRLTDIKLNGASITPAMLASADYPDTYAKGKVEQFKVLAREAIEALMAPAFAQTAGALGRAIVVVPGQPMPGQPEFDPRTDMMMMPPFTEADKAKRTVEEQLLRACTCRPDGGYDRPWLTPASYAHLLFGGHLGSVFSTQSYFTVPVNQSLVDEVVSKDQRPDTPGQSVREYFVSNMGREVGFDRTGGIFVPVRGIKMVVLKNNCDKMFRSKNEVITMHPASR